MRGGRACADWFSYQITVPESVCESSLMIWLRGWFVERKPSQTTHHTLSSTWYALILFKPWSRLVLLQWLPICWIVKTKSWVKASMDDFILTHWRKMSTKRGLYDISYHNSWYRSRKIKEDTLAQQKEKNLPFNLSLYLSQSNVRVDHRIFSNKNDQEIFKLATLLMIENPLFFMQIGNVWPKNHINCFYFYL